MSERSAVMLEVPFVLVMAGTQETEFVVSGRRAKLLRERLPGL
jgi:hypothetical protein